MQNKTFSKCRFCHCSLKGLLGHCVCMRPCSCPARRCSGLKLLPAKVNMLIARSWEILYYWSTEAAEFLKKNLKYSEVQREDTKGSSTPLPGQLWISCGYEEFRVPAPRDTLFITLSDCLPYVILWVKRWHGSTCLCLGQISVFQLPDEKKNLPKAMRYLSGLSYWAPLIGWKILQCKANINVWQLSYTL